MATINEALGEHFKTAPIQQSNSIDSFINATKNDSSLKDDKTTTTDTTKVDDTATDATKADDAKLQEEEKQLNDSFSKFLEKKGGKFKSYDEIEKLTSDYELTKAEVEQLKNTPKVEFKSEVLKKLQAQFNLIPTTFTSGGPARYWQIANQSTKIGFISPHSHNFCDTCNRVRVSSKGELFLCLGQEEKIELMPLLRQHLDDDWPIQKAILESMRIKPESHDFNLETNKPSVIRFMSHTGG